MVFLLVKNFESKYIKKKILTPCSHCYTELTDHGKLDIKKYKNILNNYEIDYIIFSDNNNNKENIKNNFYSKNDLKIIFTSKFNNRNYGFLKDKTIKECENIYGYEKVNLWCNSLTVNPPGGESINEMKNRCNDFYKSEILKLLNKKKNIIVISNQNTLNYLSEIINLNNPNIFNDKKILDIDIKNKSYKVLL